MSSRKLTPVTPFRAVVPLGRMAMLFGPPRFRVLVAVTRPVLWLTRSPPSLTPSTPLVTARHSSNLELSLWLRCVL